MAATLRYTPGKTAFEVTVGDNEWAQEIDADDESIMLHHSGGCYVVTLDDSELEGLDPNSVYELVKVATIVKPEGDFEFEKLEA